MTLLRHQDTLTAARLGLSTPDTLTCALDGYSAYEPEDMASDAYPANPARIEAEAHYGPLCCACYESLHECAYCGKRRREDDMFSYTGPVCSPACDFELSIEEMV